MKLMIQSFCFKLFLLSLGASLVSGCYRAPEEQFQVMPTTNNPDLTGDDNHFGLPT